MKQLLKKLLNRKSVVDLDNDGKIESYREEIQGVFSQFKTMHDKLTNVNGKLRDVVKEEEVTVEQANARKARAEEDLKVNEKLQKKLSEFIV